MQSYNDNDVISTGSPSTSNVSIGSLHISAGLGRSNVVTTGGSSTNPQNSLSQLIQFRTQRTSNRQRRCAYLNLNGRNSNPPAILQRLLGPSVAQNVNIGLGQVIANANGTASFRDATRVVVMDNGFGIFSNGGEPSIDLVDQAGYLFGRSLAATLNSTPSPLHWWLEEAKILGLESQADVCLTVCNDLIPELEVQRSLEMSKTRGKRKKKSTSEGVAGAAAQANKQNNRASNESAQDSGAAIVTRTNATISSNEYAEETQQQGLDSDINIRRIIVIGDGNPSAFTSESNNERDDGDDNIYDESDEPEETDDSQADEDDEEDDDDDDDNSSKNDDDVEVEQATNDNEENIVDDDDNEDDNEDEDGIALPHLIRSYVESNEEMTESDCNVHEEESNQNENEDNGGGSASDSGHSIASSVSTEAFYQVGQQQHQSDRHNLFEPNVRFLPEDNDEGKCYFFKYL